MAACHYLKDRMAEVSSPNKEMVRNAGIYTSHLVYKYAVVWTALVNLLVLFIF